METKEHGVKYITPFFPIRVMGVVYNWCKKRIIISLCLFARSITYKKNHKNALTEINCCAEFVPNLGGNQIMLTFRALSNREIIVEIVSRPTTLSI